MNIKTCPESPALSEVISFYGNQKLTKNRRNKCINQIVCCTYIWGETRLMHCDEIPSLEWTEATEVVQDKDAYWRLAGALGPWPEQDWFINRTLSLLCWNISISFNTTKNRNEQIVRIGSLRGNDLMVSVI